MASRTRKKWALVGEIEAQVVWSNKGEISVRPVKGYKVSIKGWEEYEFFVWKADGTAPGWNLSELSTGQLLNVAEYHMTTQNAIEDGIEHIEKAGKEKFATVVAENVLVGRTE